MKPFSKILKSPLLHFLLMGAALFGANRAWERFERWRHPAPPEEIVIGRAQIEELKKDIFSQTGVPPVPAQTAAAIEGAIDDEVLYREALNLHLDRNNPSVKRRLIQLAKFVGEDPKASDAVLYRKALEWGLNRSDRVVRRHLIATMALIARKVPTPNQPARVTGEELQTYLDRHPENFTKAPELSFTQIYFSRDRRGSKGEEEAKELLRKLEKGETTLAQAVGGGDSFMEGNRFSAFSSSALSRLFGPSFAQEVSHLKPRQWAGPVASSYGWHLVWVEQITPPRVEPLEAVANQIRGILLQEREAARLKETLAQLRSKYVIRVESDENAENRTSLRGGT
ncbi:MAG: peptidyl-prolyl cis-trans isomerase [bacterium]